MRTTRTPIKTAIGIHTHTMTIRAIAQAGKTQQSTLQVSPVGEKAIQYSICYFIDFLQDSP